MNFLKLAIVIFIAVSTNIAQTITDADDKGSIYNTQVKKTQSISVEDDFYIYISLPQSYKATDKSYPVLYILDGDMAYGMTYYCWDWLRDFEKGRRKHAAERLFPYCKKW